MALSGGARKRGGGGGGGRRVWGDSQGADPNNRASRGRVPEWGIKEGEEQRASDCYNSLWDC